MRELERRRDGENRNVDDTDLFQVQVRVRVLFLPFLVFLKLT